VTDLDEMRALADRLFANPPTTSPLRNPDPLPPMGPPAPVLVQDTNALASDVETIAKQAIERIKEILAHPLDRQDPNFAALLRFLASTYGSTMNTMLRADENRLRHRTIDRMPEILARVDEERRLRDARTIEGSSYDDAS
jgi:hypothetical protein